MVKVSIEVQYYRARFAVGLQARGIQRALSIAAARYLGSVGRVKLPIEPGGVSVEGSAARVGLLEWDRD